MILAHSIVGITVGTYTGQFWFVFWGSVLPDIDHIFVLLRHHVYPFRKIIASMRDEEKYSLFYKTKYVHSVFGALVFSAPIFFFIDRTGAAYFFLAYLGHLLLDWPDHDVKQYLFPFKKKFKGFLPIFSKREIMFTMLLLVLMVLVIR